MSSAAGKPHVNRKQYLTVFAALMGLTVVTVACFYLHLPMFWTVVVAMLVASIKGSLVACYFMHLIGERGMIFWILFICAIFFAAIMILPVVTVQTNVGSH